MRIKSWDFTKKQQRNVFIALDRQLELGNYDPIDWCEKALSILSHLMKNSMFLTAKKYLAITFTICSKKETMEYERYPRIFANAQGQLGKFCLSIMERKEISNDKEVPIPSVIELDPDVMSIPTKPVYFSRRSPYNVHYWM
ncbi:unnamed protein product [Lepeophtheirus salmonis]|uniref:(salmon louse) hypothetical protein n=1 Tax=Lepeophtheirus salmonis TaxID=72036 RepID=A0A7R8CEG0_LEPSM|nr:unnamed protein product [Lepeophtheirus salmonis]CAF2790783.1 unnamed protein product [Lepeophtheirus salmonis]